MMETAFSTYFNHWLQKNPDRFYDAEYLQKATIGMCKIVARRDSPGSIEDSLRHSQPMTRAKAICAMLLEPMSKLGMGSASDAASKDLG